MLKNAEESSKKKSTNTKKSNTFSLILLSFLLNLLFRVYL